MECVGHTRKWYLVHELLADEFNSIITLVFMIPKHYPHDLALSIHFSYHAAQIYVVPAIYCHDHILSLESLLGEFILLKGGEIGLN